jgi:Yip1 domain
VTIVSEFNKSHLVERVKNILLKPVETWGVIAYEPDTAKGLFTGYAAILAAIPPVARFIGGQIFGYSVFGVTYRAPLLGALVGAIFQYVLSLIGIYVFALIIEALAPSFDGHKNRTQALKVAVYSYTAAWVAGIFAIIPALAVLSILGGIYSLYLLYLGLPRVMNAPPSKALGYAAVCVIVGIVLSVVIGSVVGLLGFGAISASGPAHLTSSDNGGTSGTIHIGGRTIDMDKLNATSKQIEAATNQITANAGGGPDAPAVAAISVDILKGYLPQSIGDYSRGDVEASSGGIAGFTGSNVEARYSKDDANLTLTITDLGAAGGFAALASAFGVEANKETATGYERIGKVDGRMTTEEWNSESKDGKYGVLVADRFIVEAEGRGGAMIDLKAAFAAVGPRNLELLAKK